MKRNLVIFLVLVSMSIFSANMFSQQYYVYDGKDFSVMLTADDDNVEITKVQFSFGGKWVDFKIIDFQDLESTEDGGFLYTVQDGKKQKFTVDYYRNQDYIIITNVKTNAKWTLNRRDE